MVEIIEGMEAVTVHIRDIRTAQSFYRDVLGLKELTFDAAASAAVYAIPGSNVRLRMHVQGDGEGGREPGTVTGIIFTHRDPAAACDEIRRRGGKITEEPRPMSRPGFTTTLAAFADPDGNEFVIRSEPVRTPA